METNKKILFVSEFAGFIGGTERFIFNAAALLKSKGYHCDMLYNRKGKDLPLFRSVFEKCEKFDVSNIPNPNDYAIRTIHRIEDIDFFRVASENLNATLFVHDHIYFCPKGFKYYPYRRKNCKRAYDKLFCGICSTILPPRHFKDAVLSVLKKNFCDAPKRYSYALKCDKFAVISDFMKRELKKNGIRKENIFLISPFLKFPKIVHQEHTGKLKILFAGQFVVSKGFGLLVDSLKKMKADFELDVLGDGARMEYFKNMVKVAGLSSKINFRGFVNNPDDYYSRCDVVVFPSLWQEPFGLVGIEAMAHSKPVVAFDVGGVSEWLKDGFNGIVVPERDISSFAKALDFLAEDIYLCETLGRNARAFVEDKFTEENFLNSFFQLR